MDKRGRVPLGDDYWARQDGLHGVTIEDDRSGQCVAIGAAATRLRDLLNEWFPKSQGSCSCHECQTGGDGHLY